MRASISRIFAITKKEVAHITRDPFTTIMALGIPVAMVLIFGTAFDFNLDHISLAVHDGDHSASSRRLLDTFKSSAHFDAFAVQNSTEAIQSLESGKAMAALIIRPGFERDLANQSQGSVQILIDGSDNTSAGSILSYLPELQKMAQQKITDSPVPERIRLIPRFLFNPEQRSQWFIIPGLGVVIMAILSILLTSLTVAREWESGSMELLLSTPVRPIEIIIGKLLPYLGLGLAGALFVYAVARLVFAVPFRGNFLLYLVACIAFISTCMAQGLLISVLTRVQQVAMQFAMMSGLLPTVYLSGFIYPIAHMPTFFHYLTAILAPRWFIDITNGLYLRGATFTELLRPFFALTGIGLVIIGLAALKFKKDVEP